jgi:NADH:ubiquinone oxidoreductase subunit K
VKLFPVLALSTALFCIGIYGVIARRNAVLVLMSIELMLNAAALNFIAFGASIGGKAAISAQVFVLFIIAIAAAEVGIGIALVIALYRARNSINLDEADLLKW